MRQAASTPAGARQAPGSSQAPIRVPRRHARPSDPGVSPAGTRRSARCPRPLISLRSRFLLLRAARGRSGYAAPCAPARGPTWRHCWRIGPTAARAPTPRRSRRSRACWRRRPRDRVGNGRAVEHRVEEGAELVRVASPAPAAAPRAGPRAPARRGGARAAARSGSGLAAAGVALDARTHREQLAREQRALDAARCGRPGSGGRRPSSGRRRATRAAPRRARPPARRRRGAHDVDRVAARVHRRAAREVAAGSGCRPGSRSGMQKRASTWRIVAELAATR